MMACPYIIRVSVLWYNQIEQMMEGIFEYYEAE
jgi:hypothetical protein